MPKETGKYTPRVVDKFVTLGYNGDILGGPGKRRHHPNRTARRCPTPEMGLTGIVQSIDYGRSSIAGASVLLPVARY